MVGHEHVTYLCRVHRTRMGGCKCITLGSDLGRFEEVDCMPHCRGLIRSEREATWDDICMGERDVE